MYHKIYTHINVYTLIYIYTYNNMPGMITMITYVK